MTNTDRRTKNPQSMDPSRSRLGAPPAREVVARVAFALKEWAAEVRLTKGETTAIEIESP